MGRVLLIAIDGTPLLWEVTSAENAYRRTRMGFKAARENKNGKVARSGDERPPVGAVPGEAPSPEGCEGEAPEGKEG